MTKLPQSQNNNFMSPLSNKWKRFRQQMEIFLPKPFPFITRHTDDKKVVEAKE